MPNMRRNSTKTDKGKSDFKVVKKCTECEKEIPVACKICPLCKSYITPSKPVKHVKEEDKDADAKIRRTERIRRERPDFFNAMQVDNQFKKRRKRKESSGSIAGTSITNAVSKPCTSSATPTLSATATSSTTTTSSATTTSPVKVPSEDADVPKRKRGRPRSVTSTCPSIDQSDKISDSETKSPPQEEEEEDWYAHLPPEKFMQYKIILAEVNRKFSTQNFQPV